MYSVIIPTMWRSKLDNFRDTLLEVNANGDVKEIILIDNDPGISEDTKQSVLAGITKLLHLRMIENIYVNPAWNIGADIATEKFLVFLNDDVWCNPSINTIFAAHKAHSDHDGLFGFSTSCYVHRNPRTVTEFKDIEIVNNEGSGTGWGCMFFMKREQWVPIPKELKIWCGDDFIIEIARSRGNTIYSFRNVYTTPWSATVESSAEFAPIASNDVELFFNTISQ